MRSRCGGDVVRCSLFVVLVLVLVEREAIERGKKV